MSLRVWDGYRDLRLLNCILLTLSVIAFYLSPTSRMPADSISLKGMLITALAKASWELHPLWDLHKLPNSMKSSGRKYHYPLCLSSRYRSESHSEDRAFSIIARGPAAAEATFYQHWYSVKVL